MIVVYRRPIYHNAWPLIVEPAVLGTTMEVVGKRTSVYLSNGLAAAVAGSGLSLADLVRRGLAAVESVRQRP